MFGVLGVDSGFMDVVLPMVVVEKLQRRARRVGASIEEYLFDILMSDEEPVKRAEKYLKGASKRGSKGA